MFKKVILILVLFLTVPLIASCNDNKKELDPDTNLNEDINGDETPNIKEDDNEEEKKPIEEVKDFSTLFKSSTPKMRNSLLKEYLNDNKLDNLKESEIISLLGEPDEKYTLNNELVYLYFLDLNTYENLIETFKITFSNDLIKKYEILTPTTTITPTNLKVIKVYDSENREVEASSEIESFKNTLSLTKLGYRLNPNNLKVNQTDYNPKANLYLEVTDNNETFIYTVNVQTGKVFRNLKNDPSKEWYGQIQDSNKLNSFIRAFDKNYFKYDETVYYLKDFEYELIRDKDVTNLTVVKKIGGQIVPGYPKEFKYEFTDKIKVNEIFKDLQNITMKEIPYEGSNSSLGETTYTFMIGDLTLKLSKHMNFKGRTFSINFDELIKKIEN